MADIDVSYITEALNGKIDMPNGASQGSVDFVVAYKTPTTTDPTWYRVYKSGWVEQGGFIVSDSSSYEAREITLVIKMLDTSYSIQKTLHRAANTSSGFNWVFIADRASGGNQNTSTKVYISIPSNSYCIGANWEVKGQIDPTELQRILGGN